MYNVPLRASRACLNESEYTEAPWTTTMMLLPLLLSEDGNWACTILDALSASVFGGAPNPPVKSYETAEKKLGIRTSESRTATTQAMMIHRWRLRIKLFSESKNDFGNQHQIQYGVFTASLSFFLSFISSRIYVVFLKGFPRFYHKTYDHRKELNKR